MARLFLFLAISAAVTPAYAHLNRSDRVEARHPTDLARGRSGEPILEPGEERLQLDSSIPFVVPPDQVDAQARLRVDVLQDNPAGEMAASPLSAELTTGQSFRPNAEPLQTERAIETELVSLGAAPQLAGERIDGRVPEQDREVEEFLRANPPPTPASFERSRRIMGRLFLSKTYVLRPALIEDLPSGGALLLSNHVTVYDHFFFMIGLKRPMRFIMYKTYFEHISTLMFPWLNRVYRWPVIGLLAKGLMAPIDIPVRRYIRSYVIPVLPRKDGGTKEENERALRIARGLIKRGEIILDFPEGQRTIDGRLGSFRGTGFMKIAEGLGAPTIAMSLPSVWGSPHSKKPVPIPKGSIWPVDIVGGTKLNRVDVATVRAAIETLISAGPKN